MKEVKLVQNKSQSLYTPRVESNSVSRYGTLGTFPSKAGNIVEYPLNEGIAWLSNEMRSSSKDVLAEGLKLLIQYHADLRSNSDKTKKWVL